MKKLLSFILLLLLTLQVSLGNPAWLTYDPLRRVPWLHDAAYTRDEYHWWILNTGEPSRLFFNGAFVSEETGTNDIGLIDAWAVHYGGGSISVIDVMSEHSLRIKQVAALVSGAETRIYGISTLLNPAVVSAGISNRVAVGYKIIVLTTGFSYPDAGLSNACRYAELSGAMLFCPVPNAGVSIDEVHDYPSSWARWITSIVPVTATDRNGNLYGPNAAAWGEYVTGAPGRNIVARGSYSSGTSYAAPIVAGCLSLLMEHRPGYALDVYRNALWSTCDITPQVRRINAAALLKAP
jgi:hypothetical protein